MSSKKKTPSLNSETENALLRLEVKELRKRIDLLEKMIGVMEKSHESEMNAIHHYKTIVDAQMSRERFYQRDTDTETESVVSASSDADSESKTMDVVKKPVFVASKQFIRTIS